jgi:hypothetical protein
MSISTMPDEDIFNRTCHSSKALSCHKPRYLGAKTGSFDDLGTSTMLQTLMEGEVAFSIITKWFDSFANPTTNRFRFEFGAGSDNETKRNLPLGEIRGVTWQSTTCVSMNRYWLILPICLALMTTFLAIWTISTNWQHRRDRPVWKGSMLPLIFYNHKIELEKHLTFPKQPENAEMDAEHTVSDDQNRLLEALKMDAISKHTPATFRWPITAGLRHDAETSAFALQQREGWSRQRTPRDVDDNSLLGSTETPE